MYIKHIKPYIKPIYRMKSIQIGGLWRFMALGKHRKIGISMQVVQCLGGNRSDVEWCWSLKSNFLMVSVDYDDLP